MKKISCKVNLCSISQITEHFSFVFLENLSARMVIVLLVQIHSNLILNSLKNTQQIYVVIWGIWYYLSCEMDNNTLFSICHHYVLLMSIIQKLSCMQMPLKHIKYLFMLDILVYWQRN